MLISSTVRELPGEVAEKLPGNFGELPGKSGDFPEAQGSLTPSQRLAKFVSKSKWYYRQRKTIFKLNMHFIADTDTDENDFGINSHDRCRDTAVLCSFEGPHSRKNSFGHTFDFIADTDTEKYYFRIIFSYEFRHMVVSRERICDKILRCYLNDGAATALANYGRIHPTTHVDPGLSDQYGRVNNLTRILTQGPPCSKNNTRSMIIIHLASGIVPI